MNQYCKEKLLWLEEKLNEVTQEINEPILVAETSIGIILRVLLDLKLFILKMSFKNEEEEIKFFKYLKPQFVAKLIYYNAVYKIEAKMPFGGKEVIEEYLNQELAELKRFYDRNTEFCKYYRTNSTYLDHKYFVRGQHDIKLSLDTFAFEADSRFSTSHDYKVAKIIANDRMQVFLENKLNNDNQKIPFDNPSLNWTGTKAAAIELIYALHSQGGFNNGNADIILIVKVFESTFNIDLGDFYHTYLELKARKINQTKFLDSLRDALIKRMDEQDER